MKHSQLRPKIIFQVHAKTKQKHDTKYTKQFTNWRSNFARKKKSFTIIDSSLFTIDYRISGFDYLLLRKVILECGERAVAASARRCRYTRLQCDPLDETPPTLRASEARSLARPRPVGRHSVAKMTVSLFVSLTLNRVPHPILTRRQWGAPMGSVRRIESRR